MTIKIELNAPEQRRACTSLEKNNLVLAEVVYGECDIQSMSGTAGEIQGSWREQVRAVAYAWFAREVVQEKIYGCIALCTDNCGSRNGGRGRSGKIEMIGALHRSERQRNKESSVPA